MSVLAVGVGSVPAGAVTPTVVPAPPATTTLVNGSPGDQADPHVSGNLVAYVDFSVNGGQIRYDDLATGVDVAVPSVGPGRDSLPDVSGTTIVYVHYNALSGQRAIFSYDVATGGPPTELDPEVGSDRRQAAVGGSTVAWLDLGLATGSAEIVAYDRTTGTTTRLTSDAAFDRDPAVSSSGTVIVWRKCAQVSAGCDIWQATLAGGSWSSRQLTSGAEADRPDTNGTVIVYSSTRGGEEDIYWQPVGGGPEGRLVLSGYDQNPRISGNLVTFEHFQADAPTPNFEIYAYDLSTNALYRLTTTREDEALNDVWSGPDGTINVVWSRREVTGDDNVYASTFRLGRDTTSPAITVTSPAPGGTYVLGQAVAAAYDCTDEAGGSGLSSCAAPVANGAPIDTAPVGAKTFVVNASDNAGNVATASVTYGVTYGVCPQFDQSSFHNAGSTVPVKLQLCDARGANVSSAGVTVTATGVQKADSTGPVLNVASSGNANPDNRFRYDPDLGGFIYNLSTKGLTSGSWVLRFTVSGDPAVHAVQFGIR